MSNQTENFHGSDLEKIEKIYGISKENITSFAANINPLGISPLLKRTLSEHIDVIQTYPDRGYTALRKSISDYTGASPEHIVIGNGSTELISLFIELAGPAHTLILGPTYSEYERSVSLAGGHSAYYMLKESDDFQLNCPDLLMHLTPDINLLILCNPNNPTSSAIAKDVMGIILEHCLTRHITVIVDETYVEFTEDINCYSSVPLVKQFSNLVVLRGVSKFFAAPGLRLGYAITGSENLLTEYHARSNPWSISSLAALGGEVMFQDIAYKKATYDLIASERSRLYRILLTDNRFKVYEPHANFILVKLLDPAMTAVQLFDRTIRKGLMIRNCSTFPSLDNHFIRFCIMSPEKNDELMEQLLL
ncbi:MAG: pyridoxal phosphate-dependent class II aminotransferase [Lachnospiraceae bacterium]|nr:pyridoxal phosphate-dependent class II aminotransferase [Lachnospiraceae bacterium]